MIIEDPSHTVPSPTRYCNELHRYATWRKMVLLQRPRERGFPQCHARPRISGLRGPGGDGWTNEWMDRQTTNQQKSPFVLQDFIPFSAASLLPLIPIHNHAKQGNGYRWPHIALGRPVNHLRLEQMKKQTWKNVHISNKNNVNKNNEMTEWELFQLTKTSFIE